MTTTKRWRLIEATFDRASELEGAARAAYLETACGDDVGLRLELDGLLASVDVADDSLRSAISTAVDALSTAVTQAVIGKRLGPYRLAGLLGEGGMGTVYLAERDDAEYKRKVAIKILRHELASPQVIARFRDERQILAQLEHPAIVRLLDGGATESGLPYLVMEYVDGIPFAKYATGLPVRERIELVIRLAAALEYAHGKLIVHRDIKPSNILIDSAGDPKLLDFGIAKLIDDSGAAREAKTRTGMAMLTPEYASPEQARGEPVSVGTDVYSMGAVLYDTLVGTPPQHAGTSALDTLRIICEVDPARPSTVAPPEIRRELAGDLDSIVLKALQKRPRDRYVSIAALVEDLQRWLDGRPVSAREATVGYRTRKFVRRNRGKLALAAVVAGVLTTATIVSIGQARRADHQANAAAIENLALLRERGWQELGAGFPGRALPYLVAALRADPESAALRFSVAEAARSFDGEVAWLPAPEGTTGITTSIDGMHFLVTAYPGLLRYYDRDGRLLSEIVWGRKVYLPVLTRDNVRAVAATDDNVLRVWNLQTGALEHELTPALVSDVLAIATTARDQVIGVARTGAIRVWDATTGRLARSVDVGVALSSSEVDDTHVAVGLAAGNVRIYDLASGTMIREIVCPPTALLRFLPDGRLVVVGDNQLLVWTDGEPTILVDHTGSVHSLEVDPTGKLLAVATEDGALKVYDAHTGNLTAQLVGHPDGAYDARFALDGKRLVSTGRDGTIRVWRADGGQQELVIENRLGGGSTRSGASGLGYGGGFLAGDRIYIAPATGVSLWKLDRGALADELAVDFVPRSASGSPDGRSLLVTGDYRIELWGQSGRFAAVDFSPTTRIHDGTWRSDGNRFVIGGDGGLARVFDASGKLVHDLHGHTASVYRATYAPQGTRIVTAGDHTARVWDDVTGAQLAALPHPERVMAATWSRDGTEIVTAGWEGVLRLWDARTFGLLTTIHKPDTQFLDVEMSPDGSRIASTAHSGNIDIWNRDGTHALSLVGHINAVTTAMWSPDGRLLASSSSDGTTRIWDAVTGKQLALWLSGMETMSLQWNRDGSQIRTASTRMKVQTWNVRRDARSVDEIAAFAAEHSPYRLVDGQLERR